MPTAVAAQGTRAFDAPDGSYTFSYPQSFTLDHEFADGTGDVTGVTASSSTNGDVIVTFLGPRDAGDIKEASEATRPQITDESVSYTHLDVYKRQVPAAVAGPPVPVHGRAAVRSPRARQHHPGLRRYRPSGPGRLLLSLIHI